MKSKSVYKVPKGKLLKIFLDYDEKNKVINYVKITGDFFAYPPESIELIEDKLKNKLLDREVLVERIDKVVKKNNVQLIGIDPVSIVDCIFRGVE